MLHRFKLLHLETDLLVTVHKNQFNFTYLNDSEWERINTMIDLLHPVLEATEYLSSISYPTISDVCLTIGGLIRHFDQFIDRSQLEEEEEYLVADSIRYKLNEYWSLLDEKITIAAILD
ncbi:24787_t:CDS:1 [Dentiscutata erythropus]|uniref:24787_t:CDS:1 n=1 Tax=Dentiscutata erythropus TaxID=1348616 RepID=A0A9N9ELW0_9GLOM|nr:24787_t:CDS:1 [Dentiscutata erythropus]